MNPQENTRVVQESYALFSQGAIQNLMELYTDDVQFIFPGPSENPLPGTYQGKEQVIKFFSLLNEHINYEAFELKEFIAAGEKVVVLGHERGTIRAAGQTYEVEWVQVFTLQNGKITHLQAFLDTAAIAAAFNKQVVTAL
ncbi:MAG: nuclear transport factor 2 family protein [Adhaeribacter sp.]